MKQKFANLTKKHYICTKTTTMKHYQQHPYAYGLILAVIALMVIFSIASCNVQQLRAAKCLKWGVCATDSDTLIIKDSTAIDTVNVDNSEFWLNILFECDSNGMVLIKRIDSLSTENVNLSMLLKDNAMHVSGVTPERKIYVPKYFRVVKQKTTATRVVNKLSGSQWFFIRLGQVFASLIIVSLIIFFISMFRWLKGLVK